MRAITVLVVVLAECGTKHPGITIAITGDGFVKVDGKAVTLDELGTRLAARRKAGPKEQFEHAAGVSAVAVEIDPEDEVPWAYVSRVMVVLAEQKFWRLSFPGGRDAPLPANRGLCRITEPPDGVALLLRVFVREDGAYAFGPRTTRDVEEIGRWIDAAPREGIACRIGVLRGQPRAPWRNVRAVFDLLRGRGAKRIEFRGMVIPSLPTREQRAQSPLSPARSDPVPAQWGGIDRADYWSESGYYAEEEEASEADDLLGSVYAHRERLGLPRLHEDFALSRAASLHADEMDRLGYFGHFSPVPANHSPSDRLGRQGWPEERRHAELLAKADTAEAAFEALLAKPENAQVLADPAFRYAGVARSGDCWVVLLGAVR